jgi:hypothetical protein
MNPLWKNLLYLHGHIAHAGLAWKPDARLPPDRRRTVGAISKPRAMVRLSCAAVWPRLIAPR